MIEKFLGSKARQIAERIRGKDVPVVSPKNKLVHSYIVGIDDKQTVSPKNKLVQTDLGETHTSDTSR